MKNVINEEGVMGTSFKRINLAISVSMLTLWMCVASVRGAADDFAPGIRNGEGFLKKSMLVEDKRLDEVVHISWGDLDPAGGNEIGLGTRTGALITDEAGKVLRFIELPKAPLAEFAVVAWPKENRCRFVRVGGVAEPALFDNEGKMLWNYKLGLFGGGYLNSLKAADLDGDGNLEFVLSITSGMRLLDKEGKEIGRWGKAGFGSGTAWEVYLVDVDRDGKSEIVLNFSGEVVVFNHQGKLLKRVKPVQEYLGGLCVIDLPGQEPYLVACTNRTTIHSFDGKLVRQLLPHYVSFAQTAVVRFERKSPPYVVVLSALVDQGKQIVGFERTASEMYVFDSEWKLVYHEVLDQWYRGIGVVGAADADKQRLLLGGKERVIQYQLAKRVPGG